MRVLGLIPARGGSKGVPGKNRLIIDGKPLIQYSIESAISSKLITKFVVSTDDSEIQKISEIAGAQVLSRNAQLASDTSNVIDTVLSVLAYFEAKAEFFDAVMLLQPTAPLRSASDIDASIQLLESSYSDGVISVIPVGDHHPARMYTLNNQSMEALHPELETTRRQDLPMRYIRNGCIYLVKTEILKKESTLMPTKKSAYVMEEKWAANIDTQQDVITLKHLMPIWKKEQQK